MSNENNPSLYNTNCTAVGRTTSTTIAPGHTFKCSDTRRAKPAKYHQHADKINAKKRAVGAAKAAAKHQRQPQATSLKATAATPPPSKSVFNEDISPRQQHKIMDDIGSFTAKTPQQQEQLLDEIILTNSEYKRNRRALPEALSPEMRKVRPTEESSVKMRQKLSPKTLHSKIRSTEYTTSPEASTGCAKVQFTEYDASPNSSSTESYAFGNSSSLATPVGAGVVSDEALLQMTASKMEAGLKEKAERRKEYFELKKQANENRKNAITAISKGQDNIMILAKEQKEADEKAEQELLRQEEEDKKDDAEWRTLVVTLSTRKRKPPKSAVLVPTCKLDMVNKNLFESPRQNMGGAVADASCVVADRSVLVKNPPSWNNHDDTSVPLRLIFLEPSNILKDEDESLEDQEDPEPALTFANPRALTKHLSTFSHARLQVLAQGLGLARTGKKEALVFGIVGLNVWWDQHDGTKTLAILESEGLRRAALYGFAVSQLKVFAANWVRGFEVRGKHKVQLISSILDRN